MRLSLAELRGRERKKEIKPESSLPLRLGRLTFGLSADCGLQSASADCIFQHRGVLHLHGSPALDPWRNGIIVTPFVQIGYLGVDLQTDDDRLWRRHEKQTKIILLSATKKGMHM